MGESSKSEEYERAVNWRLDNIEKVLNELKTVLVENKMQARDILDLGKKMEEVVDAYNSHDKRIRALEMAPVQEKADKWERVMKIVMEGLLSACMLVILVKIGLK